MHNHTVTRLPVKLLRRPAFWFNVACWAIGALLYWPVADPVPARWAAGLLIFCACGNIVLLNQIRRPSR